eukprot:SAG31_NODE_249_length_19118_cov_47.456195_21_plen_67_part_00
MSILVRVCITSRELLLKSVSNYVQILVLPAFRMILDMTVEHFRTFKTVISVECFWLAMCLMQRQQD